MEDSVSVKSNDSVATSDEYEFVNGSSTGKGLLTIEQPLLKIANNGNLDDLCKSLTEVLSEDSNGVCKMENNSTIKHVPVNQTIKKVGQSMFYEVDTVKAPITTPKETEKVDATKSEDDEEEEEKPGKFPQSSTFKTCRSNLNFSLHSLLYY